MKISFVIPIYNMEQYLQRCLESIQRQSFSDFEVLMVDDGSKDRTRDICHSFTSDPRFHYIGIENSGVSVARNTGLRAAKGEWIAFVDPDDYLEDSFSAEMLNLAEQTLQNKADIICCCCNLLKQNEKKKLSFFHSDAVFGNCTVSEGFEKRNRKDLLMELFDKNYEYPENRVTAIGVPWGKLFRHSFLKEHELHFDKRLIRMQDNVFNMYAFDKAQEIVYVDQPYYVYNLDNITSFSGKYDSRLIKVLPLIMQQRADYLKKTGLEDDTELLDACMSDSASFINIMLRKYFLHPQHSCSYSERKKELKDFFSADIYQKVFLYKNITFRSKEGKVRYKLLCDKHYFLLILFEKLYRAYRKEK